MIEENWDPVQQEHFITCCTVLQIQLSPAEGLNGPPRVALEILKDYKSTCPEAGVSPLPGHGKKHHMLFRRLLHLHPLKEKSRNGEWLSLGSVPPRQRRRKEKARGRESGYGTRGRGANGAGMQQCSPCQATSQEHPLPRGAARNLGMCPGKAAVTPKGEITGVCSSPMFSRPRAAAGTAATGTISKGVTALVAFWPVSLRKHSSKAFLSSH